MYCQSCGTQVADASMVCVGCGYVPPAPAKDIGDQVKASSRDALGVLKQLAANPVGGLSAAFVSLGPDRALSAGVALCVVFALASSGGLVMGANQLQRVVSGWLGGLSGFTGGPQGLAAFIKTAVQLLVLPAAIAAASLAIRKMAGARPPVAADVFTAGAALAPLGAATLLAGLIGVGNMEIVVLMFFFALAYLVLMLYAGFTTIGAMTERAGAPAVPAAILLSAWLCKVVFAAFV